MEKYILLTAPQTNAGDYLIEKASIELLKNNGINFVHYTLNDFSGSKDCSFKGYIFAGGPLLDNAVLSSNYLPINEILDTSKATIHFWGSGIYGTDGLDSSIYDYHYSSRTVEMLHTIDRGVEHLQ